MPAQRWVDRLPARGGDSSWAYKDQQGQSLQGGWKLKVGAQLQRGVGGGVGVASAG